MNPGPRVASATNTTAAIGVRYPAPRYAAAPTTGKQRRARRCKNLGDATEQPALHHERDEETAGATARDGRERGGRLEREQQRDERGRPITAQRPRDCLVARADGERLAEHHDGDDREHEEPTAPDQDVTPRGGALPELLRVGHEPSEAPRGEAAQQPESDRSEQVTRIEAGIADDMEQRTGALEGDVDQIRGRRTDQRRKHRMRRGVLLIWRLEGEHRARGRSLEDGRHACGGAGDEQHVRVRTREEAPVAPLQPISDAGTDVDRWPLETHRAATAERRDRSDDASGERTSVRSARPTVILTRVLVSDRRRCPEPDPSERNPGQRQAHGRDDDNHAVGQLSHVFEHDVGRDSLERDDREARDRARDGGQQNYPPHPVAERSKSRASPNRVPRAPPVHHPTRAPVCVRFGTSIMSCEAP